MSSLFLRLTVFWCLLFGSNAYGNPIKNEQDIVNAILNHDNQQIIALTTALETEQDTILSADFYRGLSVWHQGYQTKKRHLKERGIKMLRKAIDKLEDRKTTSNLTKQLSLGLAKGHTARALLENEQYFTGYRTGMQAKEHIEAFLKSATPETLGYADAALMQGLYEVYTNEISSRSYWFFETINYRGNREKGIELIEATITGESIFANEAMRTLLAEVSWQTPLFCRYLEAIDQTGRALPKNIDIAILRQGLFLKCGYPDRAFEINQSYRSLEVEQPALAMQNSKALFRIFADLGDHQKLSDYSSSETLTPYRELALANSLDIANRREKALSIYNRLANNKKNPEAIQSVARVRLKYPYSAPLAISHSQFQIENLSQ